MTRGVWGIGSVLLVGWSATCGGIAVLDQPTGDAGGSSSQSTTRSVSTTVGVGPSTSSLGSTTSTTTSTGPDRCWQQPDFLSCANCLCQADMSGCQAYIDAIDAHIYCGMTCGMICTEYCSDPNTPSQPCDTCVASIDCASPPPGSPEQVDCDGFIASCQANATCVGFAQALQACPQ